MLCYAKSLQSCLSLCDPIDGSPAGSAVPGILQARILEWVAISFSNACKRKVKLKLLSHVRLSDPMDCSPPGSSVHGIFQAGVLEWVPLPSPIIVFNKRSTVITEDSAPFWTYSVQPFFILIIKKSLSFSLIAPCISNICHIVLFMLHKLSSFILLCNI